MKTTNSVLGLLFVLLLIVSSSCSKDTAIDNVEKFEVTNIISNTSKVVVGQQVIFNAVLSDTTGNISYEWKLYYANVQVGDTYSGFDIKSVKVYPSKVGEYTLRLTITRGSADKSTYEVKFISTASNFQFGIWGDNEATIKIAELHNGYEVFSSAIGIPKVVPNNTGLTTITYYKNGNFYTYYFKDAKLYAGAYIKSWTFHEGDVANSEYGWYLQEKAEMDKILHTTMPDGKIWSGQALDSSQLAYYDENISTRTKALGLGLLELQTGATTSYGRGSLHLYNWFSYSEIIFEYIIVAP